MDEAQRRKVYELLKGPALSPLCTADTVDGSGAKLGASTGAGQEGPKAVRVWRNGAKGAPSAKGFRGENKGAAASRSSRGGGGVERGWPAGRPPYLRFVLYKENIDTMAAVNHLARCLHLKVLQQCYSATVSP